MSASLQNEFISDTYTSLLHLSGGGLYENPPRRDVYDGDGNITGVTLSGTKVIANNVEFPEQHVDSADAADGNITSLIDMFFPVGTIQMTFDNVSPATRLPGTTWIRVSQGRFLVGVGGPPGNPSNDYNEYAAGENVGGSSGTQSDVSLIVDQLPEHSFRPDSVNPEFSNIITWTGADGEEGGGAGGAINQPVPNTGDDSEQPIYAFPRLTPIAQKLETLGKNQAFSISPVSYGVYIWQRIQTPGA